MRLNLSIIFVSFLCALCISSCDKVMKDDFINQDELPLATTLELNSSKNLENPSNENDIILTAKIKTRKLIDDIFPTGTISFFENENILCLDVSIDTKLMQATCSVSFSRPGAYNITAVYSGDNYYARSTSDPLLQNISKKIVTAISLTKSDADTLGSTLHLFAQLTNVSGSSPIRKPTGTVVFQDNGIDTCTSIINESTDVSNIKCSYVIQKTGSHELSVKYTGDINYEDSYLQSPITLNISKHSFSIVLEIPDTIIIGQLVTASITLNDVLDSVPLQGHLSFFDQFNGEELELCADMKQSSSKYNCTFTPQSFGPHKYFIRYADDENYEEQKSISRNIIVQKINTQIRLTSPNPSVKLLAGDPVQLIAQITRDYPNLPISGSVTFKDGTNDIPGCTDLPIFENSDLLQFVCPTLYTINTAMPHNLSVTFNGNDNYQNSDSNFTPITIGVGKITPSVEVKVSTTSLNLGQPLRLTAELLGTRVSVPLQAATFVFKEDEVTVCSVNTTSNRAECEPLIMGIAGSHTYTVHYSGDANYKDAVSLASSPVNVKAISSTELEQPDSITVGNQITLKANLTSTSNFKGDKPSLSGNVVFKQQDDANPEGKVVGQCTLYPSQMQMQRGAIERRVYKREAHTQATNNDAASAFAMGIDQTAQPSTCSVSLRIENAGDYKYTAFYNGDLHYMHSESITKTVLVQPVTGAIALKVIETEWIRSQPITVIATLPLTAQNPKGSVKFTSNVGGETANCLSSPVVFSDGHYVAECKIPKLLNADAHAFTAEYFGDANNSFSSATLPLTNVLIPVQIRIGLNAEPFLPGKDLRINARIDTPDGLPIGALHGQMKFFDNESLIPGCNISVSQEGLIECPSVLNYSDTQVHRFDVEYLDNNKPGKHTFAQVSQSVSIDTFVPNSPIYLVTNSGNISVSTTGGVSWANTQEQPAHHSDKVIHLFVTAVGDLYVATEQGHIYYSAHKGNKGTWKEVLPLLNLDGASISSLYITTNHELLIALNKDNYSVLKQLQLNKQDSVWETLGSSDQEFGGQTINAIVAFPARDNTNITKIILAHNNGMLTCRNGDRDQNGENQNWIKNNFRLGSAISSLYVGTDGDGRHLFFGTADGKIYKSKKNLDDKDTDPFGGYCPDTNPSQGASIQVNGPAVQDAPVKGLFVTPQNLSLFYPRKEKLVQDFATIYALFGNKVAISKNSGTEWTLREVPDGVAGTNLFVTPILYAANYLTDANLPYDRDIKVSRDNGKSWYSLKEGLKPIQGDSLLGAWFVTGQNGFLFLVLGELDSYGYISNNTVVSTDGGINWEKKTSSGYNLNPPLIYRDRRASFTTALWVEYETWMPDLALRNTRMVVAHQFGFLTLVNVPVYSAPRNYYIMQPTNVPAILSSIQPAGEGHVLEVSSALMEPYNDSKWKGFGGIKYVNFDNSDMGVNPNNYFSTYSLAINSSTKTWYASTSIAPEESLIRKTSDNVVLGWLDMNSPYGTDKNRIPISLFAINDSTLYASFVKSRNANDEKDAGIFVTTDDGKTWESLTTQPYSGIQGAFKIFAQYQYN